MSDQDDFIEAYRQVFDNIDHQQSGGKIVVDAHWISPAYLHPGTDYVMYLPMEVTENLNMVPRVARVLKIVLAHRVYTITTECGAMQIPELGTVQAVR